MLHPTLGIGIVGCGYWGSNYIRVLNELPDCRVTAVCDLRPERLSQLSERLPGLVATDDIHTLLSSNEIDAVVVSTEASNHFSVVKRCLEFGKHVLVEKPLTTRLDHAQELIDLSTHLGLVLMVGHTFLYNPAVRKLKEYIDRSNTPVYYMYATRTNMGPFRRDVNALWDLATHDISIFNYLMGCTPEWVSAIGVKALRNCRHDIGFISLGYPGNVVGHIHVSWADPNKAREIAVILSDKRIVFNDMDAREQIKVYEKGVELVPPGDHEYGELSLRVRDGDIFIPKIEVSEPLKVQTKHFLECIRSHAIPFTDGRNGIEVLQVLLAMDESVEQNGVRREVCQDVISV